MSSNLNGSDVKVFIEGGIHYPEGIAVDWVTGNIYWIDGKKKTIEVSDASGKLHRILVWTNLDKPRGLVLDPTRRCVCVCVCVCVFVCVCVRVCVCVCV